MTRCEIVIKLVHISIMSDLSSFDPFYSDPLASNPASLEVVGECGENTLSHHNNSNFRLLSELTVPAVDSSAISNSPTKESVSSHPKLNHEHEPTEAQDYADYIVNGRRHICLGRSCEANDAYQAALAHYKAGIQVLLDGAKEDPEEWRRDAVKIKTIKYLHHAEKLCQLHFPNKLNQLVYMDRTYCVCCNPSELRNYKVIGVLDRVSLVMDVVNNETYIMKVLLKSSTGANFKCLSKHIIPNQVPHMVKLYKYYIKRDTILLLLEHAQGGKLWTYVSSYLHNKSSATFSTADTAAAVVRLSKEVEKVEIKMCNDKEVEVDAVPVSDVDPLGGIAIVTTQKNDTADDVFDSSANEDNQTSTQQGQVQCSEQQPPPSTLLLTASGGSSSNPREQTSKCLTPVNESPTSQSPPSTQQTQYRKPLPITASGVEIKSRCRSRTLSGVFQNLDLAIDHDKVSSGEVRIPESCVKVWSAEIGAALNDLHKQGIICRDLHPDNILLGRRGHILLTYQSHWDCVQRHINQKAVDECYAAPEVCDRVNSCSDIDISSDWWSLGALTYELLCGKSVSSCHPPGIDSHSKLHIPVSVSNEARSFLTELLKFVPKERLGSGPMGFDEIKSHAFYSGIDWNKIDNQPRGESCSS